MGLSYTLQGRKKISQYISDVEAIIKEFIGMQPRPLFINPDYNRFDDNGFIYTETYVDDYENLNYSGGKKNEVFEKIEHEIERLVRDIDTLLKGDLVKDDSECKDELHWFYHRLLMELQNIAVATDCIIYKRHLVSILEKQRGVYPQIENDDYDWVGNIIILDRSTVTNTFDSEDDHLNNDNELIRINESFVDSLSSHLSVTPGFESYLNEPALIEKLSSYKNLNNPKRLTSMVVALKEMNQLNSDPFFTVTALHRALEVSFGSVGTRQSIDYNLRFFKRKIVPDDKKAEVNREKNIIGKLIFPE